MNPIKVAVVGVGRWGVHLLRNFLSHPQAQIAAIIDHHPEHLAAVKQQFNLDNSVLLTTQWQNIGEVPDLEAVAIATTAASHYPLIKDALQRKYHVLAEKPLTLEPTECEELCQLAEYQQRLLMVDHTYLFHPAVERGQAIINGEQLGELRYGYASRTHLGPVRQDVDALWDLAIHDIAIFNHWLNQTPVTVSARGTVWLQPQEGLADLVWVTLNYDSGFQAYIHLCWLNPDKQRRLTVVGSRGSLIFDEMSPNAPLTMLHGQLNHEDQRFIPVNQRQEILEIPKQEPLYKVCDRFISGIIHHTPIEISSGWVGTKLVKILSALTTSLQLGGKTIPVEQIITNS
ncbi:MAG: Gfo/Idh/MocA family oxidoreductase [Calothrix sp. MO_167.B42]|nr:Gfo/Idh/MocA family oxidoreductase [Calothrix sp. MO_167.B42]